MKLKLSKSGFLRFIENNYKVADHNSVVYEYKCLHFKVLDSNLYLTSMNEEISMVNFLELDGKLYSSEGNGEFLVNARLFKTIISKCYDELTLIIENNKISVFSRTLFYEIAVADISNFNYVDFTLPSKSFEIESKKFIQSIKNVSFAAANQNNEPSYILNSLNLTLQDGKLFFTATDSSRLAQEETEILYDDEFSITLPIKSIKILNSLTWAKNIKVYPAAHNLKMTWQNSVIKVNLIETTFANILNSRPFDFEPDTILKIDKHHFLGLLNKISISSVSLDSKKIKMKIKTQHDKTFLELSSFWEQIGNSFVKTDQFNKTLKDISVSFNADFVTDALKVFDGEITLWILKNPGRIFIFSEEQKRANKQIIALLKDQ